ncbi:MAG: polysaccharide lyase family 8 super-sandwich domain-containing protein [Candidatus Cryptobacteroides sp.]
MNKRQRILFMGILISGFQCLIYRTVNLYRGIVKMNITKTSVVCITLCLLSFSVGAKERILANYFDIPINSPAGTEVTGRIHLERNKDVRVNPIPDTYRFEILKQTEGLFQVKTSYDVSGRIMGILTVAPGMMTGDKPAVCHLEIALKDGNNVLSIFPVEINVVEKTLLSRLYANYAPKTLANKRLYGRKRYSDAEVAEQMEALRNNGWKFPGLERCYEKRPQDYVQGKKKNGKNGLTIEYDWEKVVNRIGGLGYAYATSKTYGPTGDPEKRLELKDALYQAILTYIDNFPLNGDDVLKDGKPIGKCTGDGFSMLQACGWAEQQIPTHQWVLTDALIVPVLHLMPDILDGISNGDSLNIRLQDALINYMQIFFTEIESRRCIDCPDGRWGELCDTLYSSGAWTDANLGHRSRTLLALPLIWADYNRPVTYVEYWYKDFYKQPPFEGFSYSPGWEPQGVVADVAYWMTKFCIPSHKYAQSGFHPDGTVSHHVGNATDAAMVAYGFGWLTECNEGFEYLKDTKFRIADGYYQFEADRLLNIYPKLFYRQRMDFLVAGRSFLSDMKDFVLNQYCVAVRGMLDARSSDTHIEGADSLMAISRQLKHDTYEYSGTDAYWVNDYLVHRRGECGRSFFASLKFKSERTVGAEDFGKVRCSWHLGSGILPVKVSGEEYSHTVLCNFDWHALPGLTEEWRTDALPLGHAQGSLPGLNKVSGVLADGVSGMGIYHHLPRETYSSATGYKSYHFIEDKIISLGSGIARLREGQGNAIATFVDQTALTGPLSWCAGGRKTMTVMPDESVNLSVEIGKVCWLHQGEKGYVIIPAKKAMLNIKTGSEVNVTNPDISNGKPNFIIALIHGTDPGENYDNSYFYVQIPNVSAGEMPVRVKSLLQDLETTTEEGVAHAVYSSVNETRQYAFFQPGSISVGGITVTSEDPVQIMLRDCGNEWVLSVMNPVPDGKKQGLNFIISHSLRPGTYTWQAGGIYPMYGETVSISSDACGSRVTAEIPDERDKKKYNYQSDLYAAIPITIKIPKDN